MFKVGDSVVLKNGYGSLLKGDTGIVVSLEYSPEVGVLWDGFTEGHGCGVCDLAEMRGWFVDQSIIEIEEVENE